MSIVDRRAVRAGRTPPAVVVRCASETGLRDVLAGLEEEGVPVSLEATPGAAVDLAYGAALTSTLGVGIGIDAVGRVCVHHAKRPRRSPVQTASEAEARWCGHNAARLVVGLPLKPLGHQRDVPQETRPVTEEDPWPHN